MSHSLVKRLLTIAIPLALLVLCIGAFTRLTNAGLGCPDWPGCYGHWHVAGDNATQEQLQARFPEQPLEIDKAHTEMGHRYLAGLLGLLIIAIAVCTWRNSRAVPEEKILAYTLVALLLFQASLGRWTVTLKLSPVIVMLHLAMGFATLSLLWIYYLKCHPRSLKPLPRSLRSFAVLSVLLLGLQILLGGWTSANYAALACTNFPDCGGLVPLQWTPEAFTTVSSLKAGLIAHSAQALVFIHMMHRFGALLLTIVLLILSIRLWTIAHAKGNALLLISLLGLQLALGISNVLASLPISIAVAHHACAALLLLFLLRILLRTYHEDPTRVE